VAAFMCYKQKCKVVALNLAHPVYSWGCRTDWIAMVPIAVEPFLIDYS